MQKLQILVLLILALVLTSCGLDRSNPLDPENNGINPPEKVREIEVISSGQGVVNKWIRISWDPLEDSEADGYYVYRSRSYDGTYQRINVIESFAVEFYNDRNNISPGAYFYRMSAFKYVIPGSQDEEDRLEGPLTPNDYGIGIIVPQ
ncbi:MAG: hypothetical protein B6226_00435 [Candidatus Cloacimonetes bacterium 4572_65]|nr:MAG: hypothetical protein B6226_00435 [Candidatus Cloacimonetes bacterium 4572_65]